MHDKDQETGFRSLNAHGSGPEHEFVGRIVDTYCNIEALGCLYSQFFTKE